MAEAATGTKPPFGAIHRHGFVRVALATPQVRIGDPRQNAEATLELMREAAKRRALVAVFPELGLSAYTCEDLFHQQALLGAVEEALGWLLEKSKALPLAACHDRRERGAAAGIGATDSRYWAISFPNLGSPTKDCGYLLPAEAS